MSSEGIGQGDILTTEELIAEHTKHIDKLSVRIKELEAELEREKTRGKDHRDRISAYQDKCTKTTKLFTTLKKAHGTLKRFQVENCIYGNTCMRHKDLSTSHGVICTDLKDVLSEIEKDVPEVLK